MKGFRVDSECNLAHYRTTTGSRSSSCLLPFRIIFRVSRTRRLRTPDHRQMRTPMRRPQLFLNPHYPARNVASRWSICEPLRPPPVVHHEPALYSPPEADDARHRSDSPVSVVSCSFLSPDRPDEVELAITMFAKRLFFCVQ